ncbi:MAG: hypothetical protein OXI23_19800, partial [Gemmatimonadota bacterium]|nr:hypothetical protein [Gemmatimonadota bacterium]
TAVEGRVTAVEGRVTAVDEGRVFLPESSDPNHGMEIKMAGADASWYLVTRQARARTLAEITLLGATDGNSLEFDLPGEMAGDSNGNDWDLVIENITDSAADHPAQAAFVNVQATGNHLGLTLTASTAGEAGNSLRFKVVHVQGSHYPVAAWDGDVLTVTTSTNQRLDALITVINAARRGGSQIITATIWHGANPASAIDWLYADTYSLSGGSGVQDDEPISFVLLRLSPTPAFRLRCRSSSTLEQIREAIGRYQVNGVHQLQFDDFLTLTGDGTDTINADELGTTKDFSGGAIEQEVSVSVTEPQAATSTDPAVDGHVTLIYEPSTLFSELLSIENLPTGLSFSLVHGTGNGQNPVAPGFRAVFDVHSAAPLPAPVYMPVLVQTAYEGRELVFSAGDVRMNGNDTRGMRHVHDVFSLRLHGNVVNGRLRGLMDLTYNVNSVNYPSNYYLVSRNGALVPTSDGTDTQQADWRNYIGNQEDMHLWTHHTFTNLDARSESITLEVPSDSIQTDLIEANRTNPFRIVFVLDGFSIDSDSFTSRIAVQTNEGGAAALFNNKTTAHFVRVSDNDFLMRLDGPRLTTPSPVRVDDLFVRETIGYNLTQAGVADEARVDGNTGHTWHSLTESLQHVQFFIDVPVSVS